MRTLIFSTDKESEQIQKVLGGEIFKLPSRTIRVANLLNYLENNEKAIAIIVGNVLLQGWRVYYPCHILFSASYTKDERARIQAEGRVFCEEAFYASPEMQADFLGSPENSPILDRALNHFLDRAHRSKETQITSPVTNPLLEVGKFYKTESGQYIEIAEIVAVDHLLYSLGYRYKDTIGWYWRQDGSYHSDEGVEEPEPQDISEITNQDYNAQQSSPVSKPLPSWWTRRRND